MSEDRTIVWEADLPLTGPDVLRQWTAAMLATGAVTVFILTIALGAQGEWDGLRGLTVVVATVIAGLWAFGLIVMAVLYRGRHRVRYTLSERGIVCESLSAVATTTNRAAVLLGVLARRPGLVGAGLVAASGETQEVRWKGAFRAVVRPERHLVALGNRWRTLMFVQCAPDNFDAVADRIAAEMDAHETASRVPTRSPLPFYLAHSVLVGLAAATLVAVAGEYDLDLFAPILVLCFALATLWLVNLFGYVVLAAVAYVGLAVVLRLTEVRASSLFPGRTYRGLDVLGADEVGVLLLGGLGGAYLVWLSLRAVRGGFMALLLRDFGDMEG